METCLTQPDLFLFLAKIAWTEITMLAHQSIMVMTADSIFQWTYADPSGTWCFVGDITGGLES